MERRLVMAVLLSIVVVMGWGFVTRGCTPPPPPEKKGETKDGAPAPAPGTPEAPAPNGAAPAPAPPAPTDPDAPAEGAPAVEAAETTLTNGRIEVTLTSRGAAVSSARLLADFELRADDKRTPLDLVVPADPILAMGHIDTKTLLPASGAPGGADRKEDDPGPLRTSVWTRDEKAEQESPEDDRVYVHAGRGRAWRKRWILAPGDRYDLRLEVSVTGAAAPVAMRLLASSGLLREPSTWATFMYPNTSLVRVHPMNEPAEGPFGFEIQDVSGKRVELLGERSHYFLVGLFNPAGDAAFRQVTKVWGTGEAADRRDEARKRLRAWFAAPPRNRDATKEDPLSQRIDEAVVSMHHTWALVDVPADGKPFAADFYVGPIDRATLSQPVYESVEPVIAYPMAFDIVAKALLWIYDLWNGLFGSAGLAVLLMTLVVRGALMPVSIKNQLSMRRYGRRVQRVKPKLDELRKKYAKNPQKLREEQMKLYREHGVGFPTGCLMIFIQLPIFFALFSALRAEYTLRNQSFLWIPDLAGPDRLIDLPFAIDLPILGAMMGPIHSLNLLPVLYIALTVWQMRQMPKPMDEQQAQQMKMMKWMPIVFAVLLYNYTAALALYMIVSSVIAITESKLVKRLDERDAAAQPA